MADHTPTAPDRTGDARLTPAEQLQVATAVNASFQAATGQADSKVSMLLIVHPGTTFVVATQLGPATATVAAGGVPAVVTVVLVTAFVLAFLFSGYHLVQALRPRTTPPAGLNVFAFPSAGQGGAPGRFTVEELCGQAWRHAAVLAAVAVTKNHHVARAVRWTAVLLLAVLAWSGWTVAAG